MSVEKAKKVQVLEKKALQLEYAFSQGINFEQRTIAISEDIHEDLFTWFDAAMTELESLNRQKITIKINSYGGDVYTMFSLIARIKGSPRHIVTEGYGKIMSAAFILLSCGDVKRGSKYATYMHHEASWATDTESLSNHRDWLKQMDKEEERVAEMLEEFTGTPSTTFKKLARRKDAYMSAEECLKLGVIDEIF